MTPNLIYSRNKSDEVYFIYIYIDIYIKENERKQRKKNANFQVKKRN